MSNNKMKGLLKGLRYISQIFESDEKEPEMQIGYPTDVKHVAHIGWDGPSVNSPSWMNEFKAAPAHSSDPLNVDEDGKEDAPVKCLSEGSSRRGQRSQNSPAYAPSSPAGSPARDQLPELPKSSRRRSSAESPSREKSDKPKQSSRRSSRSSTKDSSDVSTTKSSRQQKDPSAGSDSNMPDIPKKTRRKKSKDSSVGGSSRSRSKAQASDVDESVSNSRSNEKCHTAALNPLGSESEDNGFSGIS